MTIYTFQDASTWDVPGDTGFLTFASPEDAKKAEWLFNRIQAEAWNNALEEAAKVFDKYTWSPYENPAKTLRRMKRSTGDEESK